MAAKQKKIEDACRLLKIECDEDKLKKFESYKQLVLKWNEKVNLTAITQEDEFTIKHFIDSIMIAPFIEKNDINRIIDIGTGAGFPGIPISILYPEKKMLLVDSLNKRIKFLDEVIKEIDLNNVIVLHDRAEILGQKSQYREQYDLCVSRAVAKLNVLSEYCLPFVRLGGYFAAYKGQSIKEEIQNSQYAISQLGGKLFNIDYLTNIDFQLEHQIIYLKKEKKTPPKYPRKAGIPSKKPLK